MTIALGVALFSELIPAPGFFLLMAVGWGAHDLQSLLVLLVINFYIVFLTTLLLLTRFRREAKPAEADEMHPQKGITYTDSELDEFKKQGR